MTIEMLADYLKRRLHLEEFVDIDASLNGLQVGRPHKEIKRIVCAVDATLETFHKAAEAQADAVFVHHGLFWGKPLAITEGHYVRIATLLKHDMALFAAHLPLDAHPQLGNNATMARLLDLEQIEPFGFYHGRRIGFQGVLTKPTDIDTIVHKLNFGSETGLRVLPFGKKEIRSIGIVSGGAADDVLEAISLGLDAYVTGESSHTMYSYCQEAGITMICGGHYASEVFGVQQVAKDLQEQGLATLFIDSPTAL
ncbi:MAG: Nif3-like dinuclear metal center hexameric protein [Sphaerochaetaceae bacterium]